MNSNHMQINKSKRVKKETKNKKESFEGRRKSIVRRKKN
jgi:hypothetical protein